MAKDTAILFAAALILFTLHFQSTFTELVYPDAKDYAQMGRHLMRGRGFVTSYITPLSLSIEPEIPHPNLWRPPLYPLLLSLFFRIFGAEDRVVAGLSGLFFLLSVPLVYRLGRRMFDRPIALASAALFLSNPWPLHYSVSGLTEPLFLFLILLFLWLAYKGDTSPILLGAILGLSYLTRYNAIVFAPPALLFLWLTTHRNRGRVLVQFCGGFLAVIAPWLLRNWVVLGNPFFTSQSYEVAAFTQAYPNWDIYKTIHPPAPLHFIWTHKSEMLEKAGAALLKFKDGLPHLANFGIMSFFLVSIFHSEGCRRTDAFRYMLYLAAFLQLAGLLLIQPLVRLFFPFLPFVIILGIYYLDHVLRRTLAQRQRLRVAAFYVVVFLLLIPSSSLLRRRPCASPLDSRLGQLVKRTVPHESSIVSNNPWATSWYGERTSLLAPLSAEEVEEINLSIAPLDWVLLQSDGGPSVEESDLWRKAWGDGAGLENFRARAELREGDTWVVLFQRVDGFAGHVGLDEGLK